MLALFAGTRLRYCNWHCSTCGLFVKHVGQLRVHCIQLHPTIPFRPIFEKRGKKMGRPKGSGTAHAPAKPRKRVRLVSKALLKSKFEVRFSLFRLFWLEVLLVVEAYEI